MLRFHNLHLPDEVRLFTIPLCGIRRWDDLALVYDVRLRAAGGAELVLRHYGFAVHWFEVNCSLDLEGNLVTAAGPIDWCFNCDICTPYFTLGANAYNLDLELDVLVGPNGRRHIVKDEAAFAATVRQGLLSEAEQAGARRGLADLLGIIETQSLLPFLDAVCPFGNVADCAAQPPMARLTLAEAPPLQADLRRRLYGKRLPAGAA